ncbi:thermonuclease family protein [Streptomyces sp. NPDC015346]|uniref:thermonuclease family protein n=1 Tax=Streptomyces sp. NPDC015346 TaxID=3364954 RepID=UPI0036FC939A
MRRSTRPSRQPSSRRRTAVLASATALLSLGVLVPTAPAQAAPPGPVVVRVVDGDTIEVRGTGRVVPAGDVVRVRLLEIDTPERGECYFREATARTRELLPPGSTLRTETDVRLKDRNDRYLLYVWNEQGVFVNESLVRSGHARSVLFEPDDKYWKTMTAAEAAARQAGAGLWSACPTS